MKHTGLIIRNVVRDGEIYQTNKTEQRKLFYITTYSGGWLV